jgi:DNA-binding NtrC family response regulator
MAFTIIAVDDEELILTLFQESLKKAGYTVFTANNGIDALVMVKEHRPDMVFLDVSMPQMGGKEALKLIREVDLNIAVVVVSGFTSEEDARTLLADGAYDFIGKPFTLKRVYDIIEQRKLELEYQ